METCATKSLVHSFCADINVKGGLELCSFKVIRVLATAPCSVTLCGLTMLWLLNTLTVYCGKYRSEKISQTILFQL